MFSSNYWCLYHPIIYVNITFQGMIISHPRYLIVTFHSTLNSFFVVAQQFHTLICLNIIFLPLIDLRLLMWFYKYYSFKLSHKNYTLFSLKPLLSNLTFVYFWEVVSHHLHLLPQHHQSHLHLASLFASHLCHLPHILPRFHQFLNLIIISGIMFLLIHFPIILKSNPCITWLEFLEDPEQFLVRLLSIDKYLISVSEPFPCLYWTKLTLKILKQLLLEVCPQWAELVVCDF